MVFKIVNAGGIAGFYFKTIVSGPPKDVLASFDKPKADWSPSETNKAIQWYRTIDKEWLDLKSSVEAHAKETPKPELTMVYAAKKRGSTTTSVRIPTTYTSNRGNADQKGDSRNLAFCRTHA